MVFGLFSRKQQTQPKLAAGSSALIPESSIQQLRTPSPSVDSASIDKANSPLLATNASPGANAAQGPPQTPSPPPDVDDLGLISDPSALHALIQAIPPKIFHEYTLAHLIPPPHGLAHIPHLAQHSIVPPSARTLTHLTSFFSSLTPPPRLHCVRCHKFYYDVENTDRSCLVAHDDDSAEVEHAGAGKDTIYETLWECCGKTVEGNGDMGPPDGWCYEGKHTTDTKRARFRADSTIYDDKLVSCQRMRCHEPPRDSDTSSVDSSPRQQKKPTRKRQRQINDAEDAEAEVDDDARSIASSKSRKRTTSTTKPPRKKKARITPEPDDLNMVSAHRNESDVDMDDQVSVKSGSVARPKPRPKSRAKNSAPIPIARPPVGTRSAPSSPGRKPASFSHKKSSVSFSATATTLSTMVDPSNGNRKTVKSSMRTKGETDTRKRSKPLGEVVSSSITGED